MIPSGRRRIKARAVGGRPRRAAAGLLCLPPTAYRLLPTGFCLLPHVPVDLHVMRRPADGDNVGLAVAVQVGAGQVLDGYAAGVEFGLLPRRGLVGVRRTRLKD